MGFDLICTKCGARYITGTASEVQHAVRCLAGGDNEISRLRTENTSLRLELKQRDEDIRSLQLEVEARGKDTYWLRLALDDIASARGVEDDPVRTLGVQLMDRARAALAAIEKGK